MTVLRMSPKASFDRTAPHRATTLPNRFTRFARSSTVRASSDKPFARSTHGYAVRLRGFPVVTLATLTKTSHDIYSRFFGHAHGSLFAVPCGRGSLCSPLTHTATSLRSVARRSPLTRTVASLWSATRPSPFAFRGFPAVTLAPLTCARHRVGALALASNACPISSHSNCWVAVCIRAGGAVPRSVRLRPFLVQIFSVSGARSAPEPKKGGEAAF